MYKLLIVEDELSTRKWYAKVIDWQQLGFELIAIAEDGRQAWDLLQEHPETDVVMTDIRMPNMDGLQLTERIRSWQREEVEIVILSGFGEFDYAQQAIRFGVQDYLLKPATKEQLAQVFEKIACRLDERHLQANQLLYVDQIKREKEQEEKVRWYDRWLERKESQVHPERGLEQIGIRLDRAQPPFLVVAAELDHFAEFQERYPVEDQKLCRFIVCNILNEIAESSGAFDSVLLPPNRYLFLLSAATENRDESMGQRIGRDFQQALSNYLRLFEVKLSVGCSSLCGHLSDIPAAYDQAVTALRHKFFAGQQSVQLFDESMVRRNEYNYPTELEKKLIAAFKHNDEQEGWELFRTFLQNLYEQGQSAESIRFAAGEMLVNLFRQLREVKSLPVTSGVMEKFIADIRAQETFAELSDRAAELIRFILQTIALEGLSLSPVGKGVEYMKIKLDRDISLQEVADYVGMSPSYFSVLFKQEKGCNFVDFLVRLRMEMCLELLERTSLTVAQIGDEVGYRSYRYFTKVFKDYYGMTPTQFRERLKQA